METEKAIEFFNCMIDIEAFAIGFIYACWHDRTKEEINTEKVRDFMNTAVYALEKQVGKKPNSEYDDEFTCPSCGTYHEAYDVTMFKYCPECGQKIDWGDEQ